MYSTKKFKKLIRHKDILVCQVHPCRLNMSLANHKLLDGVKVFNGNIRHCFNNHLAYFFAEKHNLKMISGSDFYRYRDIARSGIFISKAVDTSKRLVKYLNEN